MAYNITNPKFSFIRFNEPEAISSITHDSFKLCLPVVSDADIAFQFILECSNAGEFNYIASNNIDKTKVYVISSDGLTVLADLHGMGYEPTRYKVSDNRFLFLWGHGIPTLSALVNVGQCFRLRFTIILGDNSEIEFETNCFDRIESADFTAVLEYGNEDNAFGFFYCLQDQQLDTEVNVDCEPTIISFTDESSLVIPYTAFLQDKHGLYPTVQVWIYDQNNTLTNMIVPILLNGTPPTTITIDFGGTSTGIVKIR